MKRITEAEWEVMEILWKKNPLASAEVIHRLEQRKGWAANTVRTLLSRLNEKGYLGIIRNAGKFLYAPAVTREECVAQEGQSFLGRVFGGATAPLLLHFAERARLSAEDARKLRELLDRKGPTP